ncbi:flippase [Brachymonas sp. M4Q-1]|uniref:flippase n=1 Tax=Brachymonas sp. M4Q-1 TaxID=3416906 RepID=UPI003CF77CB6
MSILKNSFWNMLAFAVPTIITIPAFGVISRSLGLEKFGVYTVAFAILGYASVIDIGISRAVIREIAQNGGDETQEAKILGTAYKAIFIFSFVFSFLSIIFSSEIVDMMGVRIENHRDVQIGMIFCFLSFPLMMIVQVLLAYLEGKEEFYVLAKQRIYTSTISAIVPAILCYEYKNSFLWAGLGILIGRIYTLVLTFFVVRKICPAWPREIDFNILRRMMKFGGWLTITNIISPIMVYFDRLVVANSLGAGRVGIYSGPSELVARLSAIPQAVTRSLFPKLSNLNEVKSHKQYVVQTRFIVFLSTFVICVVVYFFSGAILGAWLGLSFKTDESIAVLRILLLGFFFNSMAQIPFTELQAMGRSRLTAYVHCAEVVPYVVVLYYLMKNFGLYGVAAAWAIRVGCDYVLLEYLTGKAKNEYY